MELCTFEFLRCQPRLINALLVPALAHYNAQASNAASFVIVCNYLIRAFASSKQDKAPRCRLLRGSEEAEKAIHALVGEVDNVCLANGFAHGS